MQDTYTAEKVFVQQQVDNQLVTELKDKFVELYEAIEDTYVNNVFSKSELATEEELLTLHIQYDYVRKSLDSLTESFVNVQSALSC